MNTPSAYSTQQFYVLKFVVEIGSYYLALARFLEQGRTEAQRDREPGLRLHGS